MRILCSVIIIASVLAFFLINLYFFLVEELVFLMVSEKCCKTPKLTISHVHNTNDMTLVHLNECFNGKFNDDHCRVQNYLYCFSCKTVTPVHNNNSCKAITPVHNNHKKHKFDM